MRAPDVATSTDWASLSGGKGKKGSSGFVGVMVTDPAASLQRAMKLRCLGCLVRQ